MSNPNNFARGRGMRNRGRGFRGNFRGRGGAAAQQQNQNDQKQQNPPQNQETQQRNYKRTALPPCSAPLTKDSKELLVLLQALPRGGEQIGEILGEKFEKWTEMENLNPFSAVLGLIENSEDYMKNKRLNVKRLKMIRPRKTKSLSARIAVEFDFWITNLGDEKEEEFYQKWLDDALKLRAFLVASSVENFRLLPAMAEVFRMQDVLPLIQQNIMSLIRLKRYRMSCLCVNVFSLAQHFTLSDLIIPCLLQGGRTIAALHLDKSTKETQTELIVLLDKMLVNYKERLPHMELFDSKPERQINDVLKRTRKQYRIPLSFSPNHVSEQIKGAIRHVISDRYPPPHIEHTRNKCPLIDPVWEEQINILLSKRPDLSLFFLDQLCYMSRDFPEAARWAAKLNVPMNNYPQRLQKAMKTYVMSMPKTVKSSPEGCAQLPESVSDKVILVDSIDSYNQLMTHLNNLVASGEKAIIGLDSEWQPAFVYDDVSSTAIIQVAFRDRVLILDLISLESFLTNQQWISLFKLLLCGDELLKIGFDFRSDDITNLVSRVSIFAELQDKTKVVCLQKLAKELYAQNPETMPGFAKPKTEDPNKANDFESDTESESESPRERVCVDASPLRLGRFGLATLYEYCTKQSLNKSEQMSDWARRPLRDAQISYAAMDAYCQMEIFDWLKTKAEEFGLDFDEMLQKARGEM